MFEEKLSQIVRNVEGTLGCLLIGFDGIPIERIVLDEDFTQMEDVAVELSNLLDDFERLQAYDLGGVDAVSVSMGDVTTLARIVADEYLLMLVLRSEADVERGQNMLRLVAPSVEREIQ